MARQPVIPDDPPVPIGASLRTLRELAEGCRNCDLYRRATQTVFGEGAAHARVVMVGETPGNDEDLAGKPFVGPAGKLLDRALVEAGIERRLVYLTNAVKHFKWEPRESDGRRLHKKPGVREQQACRPWLEAELAAIKPDILVCLGATAAQALLGKQFRVSTQRGRWIASTLAPRVIATVHPASILRAQDDDLRHLEMKRFVDDLKKVAREIDAREERLFP